MEKNNHHFVPQFYLKKFSNNNKSIGLYLFDESKYVIHGSIKQIAYRKHLYGKDNTLEDNLDIYESKWNAIINSIIRTKSINLSEDDYYLLLLFIMVTEARTSLIADYNNKQINTLMDLAYKMKTGTSKTVNVEYEIPNLLPLKSAINITPILLDLNAVLIINESNRGFITSDNPIVRYNQYLRHKNNYSNYGLGHIGIQIFVPLCPEICICVYDRTMYSPKTEDIITISSGSQINELNKLFLLNSYETIFFNNKQKDSYIKSLVKHKIQDYKLDVPVLGARNNYVIPVFQQSVKERIKLDFFKINPEIAKISLSPQAPGPMRPYAEEFSKNQKEQKNSD